MALQEGKSAEFGGANAAKSRLGSAWEARRRADSEARRRDSHGSLQSVIFIEALPSGNRTREAVPGPTSLSAFVDLLMAKAGEPH
jgi:hypothetical protein